MTGFDIKTLVDFQPPKYLCKRCSGILFSVSHKFQIIESKRTFVFECPTCDQVYIGDDQMPEDYFDDFCRIEFGNLLEHSQRMAKIVRYWGKKTERRSPIEILLNVLTEAKRFVHFTTWGINSYFIGALKLIGIRVPVNGIVSNPHEYVIDELEDNHSPKFKAKIFPGVHPGSYDEMPHQKLIVVDGLIAFKGSANLTTSGWEKAAEGKDLIEVVTNVQEIAKLNNSLFAPNWAGEGPHEPIICNLPPF